MCDFKVLAGRAKDSPKIMQSSFSQERVDLNRYLSTGPNEINRIPCWRCFIQLFRSLMDITVPQNSKFNFLVAENKFHGLIKIYLKHEQGLVLAYVKVCGADISLNIKYQSVVRVPLYFRVLSSQRRRVHAAAIADDGPHAFAILAVAAAVVAAAAVAAGLHDSLSGHAFEDLVFVQFVHCQQV
ncbi:hypothetical protein GQX74_013563 [Glossina fuscipes]|nr:hypothetical protein GQX74_013563 [Glossina fuscipes]